MNDHELDLALDAIGTSRTQVTASPALRERVRAVPLEIPQRRSWLPQLTGSFGAMFSATKFVVAGAILALFGGFVLAAVLTQPSEELVPAIGASPSPAPSGIINPLQGAVTEEVGPGVVRVVADVIENDLTGVEQVAVAADGTVWVTSGPFYGRLGQDELGILTLPGMEEGSDWRLTIGADGVPIAHEQGFAGGIARLEGDRWQPYPTDRWEAVLEATTTSKGDLWASVTAGPVGDPRDFAVGRYDGDDWTWYDRVDVGVREGWVNAFAETPDGSIWAGVQNYGGPAQGGLSRFDGREWHPVDPFSTDGRFAAEDLVVTADGTLWAGLLRIGDDGRERYLGAWDGSEWVVKPCPQGHHWGLPTGGVGVHEPCTDTVTTTDALEVGDWLDIDRAPDGTVWWTTDTGLYVMDPEVVETIE